MEAILCFFGVIILVGVVFLTNSIKIVPEFNRLVVFRLGRVIGSKGPGLVLVIPIIDRAVRVDLREQTREVKNVSVVTKDNSPVTMDYVWNYRVVGPVEAVLQVGNFEASIEDAGKAVLRTVIGNMNAIDLSEERGQVNFQLRSRLEEFVEPCGVKVTNAEIRKLIVDDRQAQLEKAHAMVGTIGETQTTVHTSGTVLINGQVWDAISERPIAPKSEVRIKRILLEVEDSASN